MPVKIDSTICKGEGKCAEACPSEVLAVKDGKCIVAKPEDCVECGTCVDECPHKAIILEES